MTTYTTSKKNTSTQPLTEAMEVKQLQTKLLQFVRARENALMHSETGMSEKKAIALLHINTNFKLNNYKKLAPFCAAVVKYKEDIALVSPLSRSPFYKKTQHLEILAMIEKCEQMHLYANTDD